MDWKTITASALIGLVVVMLIFALAGGFAYDRGVYVRMEGLTVNSGELFNNAPIGVVMAIYIDRGLGADRRLFMSQNPQAAWSFYQSWMNRGQMTLRFANPGGP